MLEPQVPAATAPIKKKKKIKKGRKKRRINSRAKGAEGEREFAKWLRENLGIEARRGQQYAGSSDSPDIVSSLHDIHFEVKRVKNLHIKPAMAQAENDCGQKVPVVAYRGDGEGGRGHKAPDWLFIFKAGDLLRFCEAFKGIEK